MNAVRSGKKNGMSWLSGRGGPEQLGGGLPFFQRRRDNGKRAKKTVISLPETRNADRSGAPGEGSSAAWTSSFSLRAIRAR